MKKTFRSSTSAMLVTAYIYDIEVTELAKWFDQYKLIEPFTLTLDANDTGKLEILIDGEVFDDVLEQVRKSICMHNRVLGLTRPADLTYQPVLREKITGAAY